MSTQRIDVNKHTSILVIGKGATSRYIKQIVYGTTYEHVLETFGDSDLTSAYQQLTALGAKYIFLLNLKNHHDYLDMAEIIKQHDFAYILPVSIMISDKFDDPTTERRISYVEYLLEYIGKTNESVFVLTDKHATLYEDIDSYLTAMNRIAADVNYDLRIPARGENLIFVANNLYDYSMANIPLVASLCTTSANVYPQVNFGPAVFEIDEYEKVLNYAYFRNHTIRNTTVENLLNFKTVGPEKLVFIQRIIKKIKRELDFSEFVGRQYTEYRRLLIEGKLERYLDSMMNELIRYYEINGVVPYRDPEPMCIDVDSNFDIYPVNCLDKCTIAKTVTVA